MKFNKVLLLGLSVFLAAPIFAKPLQVVTSFAVLADMTQQIAGDKATVVSLTAQSGNPHSFEASPKDSALIKSADLVVINGLGLDSSVQRLAQASGCQGKLLKATDGIEVLTAESGHQHSHSHNGHNHDHDHEHEHANIAQSQSHDHAHSHAHDHDHGSTDPHAWNSLQNGIIYVNNITKFLVDLSPEDAAYFQQRSAKYVAELKAVDANFKQQFALVPKEKRKVLTSHDAFGYFAAEYEVKFLAPLAYSTEAEASAKKVADLINTIKQEQIKVYFIEDSTDKRLVEQVAKATGAQLGGTLYPESLSEVDGPAATYLDAFKHNASLILQSFK